MSRARCWKIIKSQDLAKDYRRFFKTSLPSIICITVLYCTVLVFIAPQVVALKKVAPMIGSLANSS